MADGEELAIFLQYEYDRELLNSDEQISLATQQLELSSNINPVARFKKFSKVEMEVN